MSSYIVIAIVSYLALAVNSVIDKFLLKKAIPDAATYAFYIGILSAAAFILAPFGFMVPSAKIIFLALVSGAFFVYALTAFYVSLKYYDVSVVLPTISAIVPVITFILSFFIVGERLHSQEIMGLGLLVIGTAFISDRSSQKSYGYKWLLYAVMAALFFSISFTLAKVVYLDQNFISGLIWTRLGLVIGAFSILLSPASRRRIFVTTKSIKPASGILFFSGQILAAGGGILQNLAVSLGSVTLTNALQGTQFAFLFVLTAILSRWYPRILKEDFSKLAVARKLMAIVIISFGLAMIARL